MNASMRAGMFKRMLIAGVVSLGACGGGGSGGGGTGEMNAYCRAIWQPNSSVICSGCTGLQAEGQAFDGHLDTFAVLSGGGSVNIEGNNSPQAAGEVAGVYYNRLDSDSNTYTITITTFRNGVQQETGAAGCQISPAGTSCASYEKIGSDTGGPGFVGLQTTKPFDAIQASISSVGVNDLDINELCVR